MNSTRQEKFARLMQRDLADIFLKHTHDWFEGKFITISSIHVSPDLGYVKVFLSVIEPGKKQYILNLVEFQAREIRKELAQKIRNQVRKVPELTYFVDESLDYVMKMENLFNHLHQNNEMGDHRPEEKDPE